MADHFPPLTDRDLERALSHLAHDLEFPPTPDLAPRVRRHLTIAQRPARPAWKPSGGRVLRVAAAIILLLIGAAWFGSTEVARTVADRLGVRGIPITHLPFVPDPAPTSGPAPTGAPPPAVAPTSQVSPTPLGAGLFLGERTSLEAAQARRADPILLPDAPGLGLPDEVYFAPLQGIDQVALLYHPRPDLREVPGTGVGLLLTQFRGDLDPRMYGKMIGPETEIEELTIGGERAVWLSGRPHLFVYRDPTGEFRDDRVRLAGNVLLWERGNQTLRLESGLSRGEAIRIAESIR
ncbi:MAG TPA: hypothetical protein VHL09_04300 [Dehalococcoidia bacterium]|nr:hypothetical protein [Dehalococcoidia bacterium]